MDKPNLLVVYGYKVFPRAHPRPNANGISIVAAVLEASLGDRQTDWQTDIR